MSPQVPPQDGCLHGGSSHLCHNHHYPYLMITASAVRIPPQPKTNIWVTLADKTGQDMLCLSTASPENPFTTCLVGQPIEANQ